MSDKFWKGFSLEDYKLQLQVSSLEKEKQQCLNRLNEEQHLFKMSSRLHLKHGDDYWSQYGENYHANGDKRERGSFTCILTSRNDQRREEGRETGNYAIAEVKMAEQSSTSSESESVSVNSTAERINIGDRRETDSRRKRSKSVGPTLLEILCGDFDCGILSLKSGGQYGSEIGKDFRNHSKHESNGRGLEDKGLCQRDGQRSLSNAEASLLEVNGSSGKIAKPNSGSVELTATRKTFFANWCSNSEPRSHNGKLSLNHFSEEIFGTTPESLKPQKGGKTFQPAQSSGGWCKEHRKEVKETEKKIMPILKGEDVAFQTRPEVDMLIRRNVLDHCDSKKIPEQKVKTPEQFNCSETMESTVSFEMNRTNSRKADAAAAADKSHVDETCKTGCTGLSNSMNSRNGAVKALHLRKSQDEIDKEMRDKMDQFFAKVELTKNYQSKNERWRCNCSGRNSESQIKGKQTSAEQITSHYTSNKQGYRRAAPWPTEVWS